MGQWLSKLKSAISELALGDELRGPPIRILMLGLDAAGLIFVVDSSDKERLFEARDELFGILKNPEIGPEVPVVVPANKQDLPGALKPSDVAEALSLHQLSQNPWYIQATCAPYGEGIYEAVGKLAKMVRKSSKGGWR